MTDQLQDNDSIDHLEQSWRSVQKSLANDKWDFRTIEGIARETNLEKDIIKELLELHGDEVRQSLVPDSKGRVLYRLRKRGRSLQEIVANSIAILSKST
tara:strand:+ start:691 stop:987 length:297 start_codon:yes stop_codon:yes gene_type:complete